MVTFIIHRGPSNSQFQSLVNFHTGIFSIQAGFLNEVDPVKFLKMALSMVPVLTTGWLGRTHKDLDIDPVKSLGPAFRKQVLYQQGVRYLAPKNDRGRGSYWSRKVVAQGGQEL